MATSKQLAQEKARRYLRLFLNDTPELNRLIRRQESTDDKLDLALVLAIDDYCITPPLLGQLSIENFPSPWLLLYGATIQVLRSAGLLQSRNELMYQAGNVSVRIFDKTGLYQSWIATFMQDYERKKQAFKIAQNIAGALGDGVRSEYSNLMAYW